VDVTVFAIAMRERFRGLTTRDGVLIRGDAGWGEFSPFWEYDDVVAHRWWLAATEAADIGWPEPRRAEIPVNVTVPAVDPASAAALVRESGCATAKVKVAEPGQSHSEDIERVAAVRDALGPGGWIRVDANAAWDARTAIRRLRELARAAGGLQYAEQPCASLADLAAVRRATDVPVAADESIRLAADPLAVVRAEAADVAVLKVQPLGGVRACLEIAERLGIPVVVSSALETSVGLAAGVALAAALPELDLACGLGTARLLAGDLVADPLLPVGGMLPVRRPEVDPRLLARHAADPELTRRWTERLSSVAGALR
jgi:O-succinylbenzoate synthase